MAESVGREWLEGESTEREASRLRGWRREGAGMGSIVFASNPGLCAY